MNILIVDCDSDSLAKLKNHIMTCRKEDKVMAFTDSVEAMKYIKEHNVDILFTEVKMPSVTGFALTKCLKEKMPNAYVVFVTKSEEYAMHAWEAHVNGYLIKPVNQVKVQAELECIKGC